MTKTEETELLLHDIHHELKIIRIILSLKLEDHEKHQIDVELAKEFGRK
ncbi:MAG: hypothetical protein KKA10_08820 [Euryarchaeota archaeon]|nr:hypothetical protein [Euryarchaeota archaeon]MCG2737495.1 hypothetical protein [Candidatus Methanoperedenaceae archaeon]